MGFWADRFRTLVSMATDTSHRVKIGKTFLPLILGCFQSDHFILAGNQGMHESSREFEVRPDPTTDGGFSYH